MRTTLVFVIVCAICTLTACNPNNKDQERAITHLDNYVDSVANATATHVEHDWDRIESRYSALSAEANRNLTHAKDETRSKLEQIDERFREMRDDARTRTSEFNERADAQLSQIEQWYNRTTTQAGDNMEQASENVKEGFEESMEWMEDNYERLEDNVRRKYDDLKDRINDNDTNNDNANPR